MIQTCNYTTYLYVYKHYKVLSKLKDKWFYYYYYRLIKNLKLKRTA